MLPLALCAQDNKVIVAVSDSSVSQPAILVKWFTSWLFPGEGMHVYRSLDNQNWVKLTTKPIVMGTYKVKEVDLMNDTTLQPYMDLAMQLKPADVKSITKVMFMVKASFSHPFAKYIGMAFDDTGVTEGLSYKYKVTRLINGTEQLIGFSPFITAGRFIPSLSPQNIEITAGDKQVTMKWKLEETRFLAVNIYRASSATGKPKRVNKLPVIVSQRPGKDGIYTVPDVFYTDSDLENGVWYRYQLAGIDYFGRETALSTPVVVMPKDTTPPEIPSYVRCSINNLDVAVKWDNPYENSGIGYHVYRSKHYNKGFVRVSTNLIPKSDTMFIDKVPGAGKYYYYVENRDINNNCSRSHFGFADVPDITPPLKPRLLKAVADTGVVKLSWAPNNDPDLLGYQLYRTINNNDIESVVLMNADPMRTNSFIDSLPLKAKNRFFYRVAAVDSSLNRGDLSDPASAVMPDAFPPEKPCIKNVFPDSSSLVVEWIPNADADLMGYILYRASVDSSINMRRVNIEMINKMERQYRDNYTGSGKMYYYTLVAVDSAGNRSPNSDLFTASLPRINQQNIRGISLKLQYREASKKVELSWVAPANFNTTGAIVFRRNKNMVLSPITGLLTDSSYSDSVISSDETYYYQIRMYDNAGNHVKTTEMQMVIR